LLGENILAAPIFHLWQRKRDVFLPGPATWTHLWSGQVWEVDQNGITLEDFAAPIGEPAIFTRNTEKFNMDEILATNIEFVT